MPTVSNTASKRHGAAYLLLGVLVLSGVVSGLYYAGFFSTLLCVGCPNSVGFNGPGSRDTLKIQTLNSGLSSVTATNPSTTSYGTVSWPIGNSAAQFTISNPPFGNFGTWDIIAPADQPASCWNSGSASSSCMSSSYQFTSSIGGPSLLTSQNNAALWAAESSNLPANPYAFTQNFTSSVTAPKGCSGSGVVVSTSTICTVQFYLYRFYFTVNLQTNAATISVFCNPGSTCQAPSSFFGAFSNYQQYKTAFQSGVTSALGGQINPAMYVTSPTRVSLQLNLPSMIGGQSNLDSAGIVAAWTLPPCTGGSGIGVGDLCETNCVGTPGGFGLCSIVQSNIHTSLALYGDPGMTQAYNPILGPLVNVQGYNAAQLAAVTPSSLSSTVYTGIDVNQFGAQFSMNQNCFVDAYTSCFSASSPQAVLTVGFDVLTTKHFYTTYPTPPPQTGTNAGAMDGQAIDGSLFWHPGVPGATVCFQDITGCVPVSASGFFNSTNVPSGTHTIQITAPGYYPTQPLIVQISNGLTAHLGQVSMVPLNPWYSGQLCLGILGQGPCIPYFLLISLIGGAVVIGVAYAYFQSQPARAASKAISKL